MKSSYDRKKILVLASTFPRWKDDSTPPFVLELERRLTKSFDIQVLAPHFFGVKKKETIDGLKINRFQYFWPASWQTLCYEGGILPNIKRNKFLIFEGFTLILFELIAAAKIIRKEKIQLIHAHWIIPQGIVALVLYKLFGTPYIVTVHGGDIYGLRNSLFATIKKQILQNARTITVVSSAIKDEILSLYSSSEQSESRSKISEKIEVISMGVDSKLFNPDKYDKKLKEELGIKGPFLLFVGRLAEKKGVKYLIQAMPDIIKKFPLTKLVIIGEGPLEKELKDLVNDLGITYNVIFTGPIPNSHLPKYYATADIFISPSIQTKSGDTEGLGLTFVEASFSGAIPIGTKIGGISDVIENNKTGFLVEQKNSKMISQVVLNVLSNKKLIEEMKKNSRESTITKFDWKIIAERYGKLYSQLKVVFKVIKAGSGNDIYFERLSQALKTVNIDSEIQYYNKYFQYFPWLLLFFSKNSQGDIIHSNVEYGWLVKENNKPLYVTLHHNVFDPEFRKYTSFSQRIFHDFILKPNIARSLKGADKIIAVSKYTKKTFIESFGNFNIDVIYNFIDTDKFKPIHIKSTDKRFKLLFVGNLIKRKGADLLPKIMADLGKDYVLYYTTGLRTNIPKDYDLPNMIPLGKLSEDELIREYNKSDALLFPSRFEGFGYAVAEAMACGKPVIAFNNSSISELIPNENKKYLSKQDNLDQIVEKVRILNSHYHQKVDLENKQMIQIKFSNTTAYNALSNFYQLKNEQN